MFATFPICHYSSAGVSEFPASVIFDLDATQAASFTSGQTWANLIASPADGESQTAYDFFLGIDGSSSSDDPTFTGSAGDSGAYFEMDGGDFFALKSGANTTFLEDIHKTTGGSDFWFAFAWRTPIDDGGSSGLFTTQDGIVDNGLRVQRDASETLSLVQANGSGVVTVTSAADPDPQINVLLIMSHSHSANQTRIWYDSTTAEESSHTFGTTTTDATLAAKIGVRNGTSGIIESGTRIYAVSGGNAYLDDDDATTIANLYGARHSRTYLGL